MRFRSYAVGSWIPDFAELPERELALARGVCQWKVAEQSKDASLNLALNDKMQQNRCQQYGMLDRRHKQPPAHLQYPPAAACVKSVRSCNRRGGGRCMATSANVYGFSI
jgi:hypothetical protein